MIASWFLATAPENHIASARQDAVVSYWRDRSERHDYFWSHDMFGGLYASDERFRNTRDEHSSCRLRTVSISTLTALPL